MEPRRGDHEQEQQLRPLPLPLPGKTKKRKTAITAAAATSNEGAVEGACLCPGVVALTQPVHSSSARDRDRDALEQEVLARADLLQHGGVSDRRWERRMRNRASAERSRARRHAYMNELEAEVRDLRQENEELKKLCDELREAAAEVQLPPATKTMMTPRLQKTSSSPF